MKAVSSLIVLACSCAAASVAWSDTITIRADSWCPMNCEPGTTQPGYMIEFAREIAEQNGHSVDYQTMPWRRAVDSVREGQFDCVVGAYVEDAPDFRFPDEHWGLDQTAVYAKADSDFAYDGLDSLQGEKIGVIGGYAYSDAFDAFAEQNPDVVQWLNADNALENNIRKVLAGRLTATLESPAVMGHKLKSMGVQSQMKRVGYLGEGSEMYIACSPAKAATAGYVTMFSEGTRQLRDSGRLQEILADYGLEDWK
ncbi:substrate-binding periplasmic protein [Saccharospirillum salsuginis]|uniref:Solute-binding protein family 3/N-terminal domain-containing protein n=1 Tax=Saccharospirillum salsuginis TaxID=418750 RepID=A0A918NH47_9GAMM|nr:transporter substrate-binding domain-containing protein [Saccharospirillum salsuginis]GGX66779.1 hypothetical protein GCM10007392_38170 [Saccharospirillum salsuginis]